MQWAGLRRAFPWRTGLLMYSLPALAFALFVAWFRWELSPLEGYYLMTYWESSKTLRSPRAPLKSSGCTRRLQGGKASP